MRISVAIVTANEGMDAVPAVGSSRKVLESGSSK